MAGDLELRIADLAWSRGYLSAARLAYRRAAVERPGWHAEFQLATLDLAFAALSTTRLARLVALAPSRRWRSALTALVVRCASGRLEGDLAWWDREALRQVAPKYDASWWEARGAYAHYAGLYGLACACCDEAATCAVGDYAAPAFYAPAVRAVGKRLTGLRRPPL
jgi:hypothetical protein